MTFMMVGKVPMFIPDRTDRTYAGSAYVTLRRTTSTPPRPQREYTFDELRSLIENGSPDRG